MTKLKLRILALTVVIIAFTMYLRTNSHSTSSQTLDSQEVNHPKKTLHHSFSDSRQVASVDQASEQKPSEVKKNFPSQEPWEEILVETLHEQGGSSIKEIKIKKIDSFTWKHHGTPVAVESVIVSLKNDQNESSSFRALVDSQTGKILESWDRPVSDPVNPKQSFALKIDPRYFND